MLSRKNITPEQTRKRGAERRAKRSVIDTDGHAVHCCPKGPVANGDTAPIMNLLPLLDDAAKQYRGANVCPRKLHLR